MAEDTAGGSWLPDTNRDQSCAFCGAAEPSFAHPLDAGHVRFRVYGKGWTLPTFWAACRDCEANIASQDDDGLSRRMLEMSDDEPLMRASLGAFRAADRGPVPLGDA